MRPGSCQERYDDALSYLLPGLGLLVANKQIYKEAQPIPLQENTIRFENLAPPGVPDGQNLELMKRVTTFQIFFNFLTTGIEEVVEMLVAHPKLHTVSLHFQFIKGTAPWFLYTEIRPDKRGLLERMSILKAFQGPEVDRWERLPEILEPLHHLNVKNDIHLMFHNKSDPKETVVVPPIIF